MLRGIRLLIAGFGLFGLAAAGAQESTPIGPPELSNFSIGPPPVRESTPPPVNSEPPPETSPPADNAVAETAPPAAARSPAQRPRAARTAPPQADEPASAAASIQSPPTPAIPAPPPTAAPQPQPQSATPAPAPFTGAGPLLILAGLALLVASLVLLGRRRARAARPLANNAPLPEQREAPPPPRSAMEARPRLELEFNPERVTANGTYASVHFALVVRNVGNRSALAVRVEPRMFDVSAERGGEVAAFFAMPIDDLKATPSRTILPGGQLEFRDSVAMPQQDVRQIKVADRLLFIPMVAINVFYQWSEGGPGQTSATYIVGREPESPTQKMGPFRLDLGPRIYRSVGQRKVELELQV